MPSARGVTASGPFDSVHARLAALCKALDVPLPGLREPTGGGGAPSALFDDNDDDVFGIDDGTPQCCICLTEQVDTALTPCFHAAFCHGCASGLLKSRSPNGASPRCPIGRCAVKGLQRIYL